MVNCRTIQSFENECYKVVTPPLSYTIPLIPEIQYYFSSL